MDVSVLEREQVNNQYNNQFNMRTVGYTSLYSAPRVEEQPVQNMTPNRLPNYQPQNYDYMNVQSDNINMNVNSYDMAQMVQQNAGYYSYYPYYNEQQYLNNVSANVQTHPTNYYQQAQLYEYANSNSGYAYNQPVGQVAPQQNEYERVLPQKSKAKNKRTKALIAVYFMIVAVCAALIIVNVVAAAGATQATAATVADSVYTSDSVYYTVDEGGNVTEMAKTEQIVDYKYDTTTNWFDRLCDKIGNILG